VSLQATFKPVRLFREIEFIANAQQLIWGGKQYALRTPTTLDALTSLANLGHINQATAQTLKDYYIEFRTLENAVQMLDNNQNHIVPSSLEQQRNIMGLLENSEIFLTYHSMTLQHLWNSKLRFQHYHPQRKR